MTATDKALVTNKSFDNKFKRERESKGLEISMLDIELAIAEAFSAHHIGRCACQPMDRQDILSINANFYLYTSISIMMPG